MEIIVTHANVDFDSFAAMVASQKLYPDAKLVFSGTQNKNVREFFSLHQEMLDFIDIKQLDKEAVSRVIVVDTRIASRLGELGEIVKRPTVEVFTFDHHPSTDEDMRTSQDFSEETGATTTILAKIIRKKGINISPLEATLFALGIHEDTGSLTYPTTTYNDVEAVAFLMAQRANIKVVNHFLNQPLTKGQQTLLKDFLETAHTVNIHGVDVLFASAKADAYVDGASVLTHKMAELENVGALFTLITLPTGRQEMKDRTYIIGRSRMDEIDVGAILTKFAGGGHPQAASAAVKGISQTRLEARLVKEISSRIQRPLTAAQIMSAPVHTIDISTTIREASKAMTHYRYTGFPVLEKGKLVGVISKHDLSKAAFHGLGHAPVKGFMSHRVITVSANQSLHEIQNLLVERNIGRLPVVEDGKIVGIITRVDLLKALYGSDYITGSRVPSAPKSKFTKGDVRERIRHLLPGNIQILLRQLGDLAEKDNLNVYLVGGFVRDLLMNHPNLDIDLVVEGDGIDFASSVVSSLGGRLKVHQKFGTAVIILPSGFRIDIASARTEFYEYPAALPQVELSSIKQDLSRRDFSVNAMALALNTSRFGELLDFFGGEQDIRKKFIRVLHNLSFIEDPTRVFRAVRFEQRYGFRIEAQTEKWACQAIEMRLVGELTNVRVRDELILILSEGAPWPALERLFKLGALQSLFPKLKIDQALKKCFNQIKITLLELEPLFSRRVTQWLVYLMALLSSASRKEIEEWGFRMRLKKIDTQILVEGVTRGSQITGPLNSRRKMRNSELYRYLRDFVPESVAYIFATNEHSTIRQRIIHYLDALKDVKLCITGSDLIRKGHKPSAAFNLALESTLKAKLDGLLRSKKEELAYASQAIKAMERDKEN